MNRADRTTFDAWQPSQRLRTSGRAGAVDVARELVIAAHPATLNQARGAAGYVYRLLAWAAHTDHYNNIIGGGGPTLAADQVNEYLAHLQRSGAAKGTIDAARSYLTRCVTGGPGLNGHKRPHRATPAEVIAGYQPDPDRISEHRWARTGPITRNAVTVSTPADAKAAASAMHIVALYIAWAEAELIDPDAYFDRETVEEFVAVGSKVWPTRTLRTYRSRLRAVARANKPDSWRADPNGERSAVEPYSDTEVARIAKAIASVPTRRSRGHLEAAFRLALHAGVIGADAAAVRTTDVSFGDPPLVTVRGARTRTVPLSQEGADALSGSCATADELGDGWLLGGGPNRTDRASTVWDRLRQEGIDVKPRRLRERWLCRLVATPVPLAAMLDAAGLDSAEPLVNALRWVHSHPAQYDKTIADGPDVPSLQGGI